MMENGVVGMVVGIIPPAQGTTPYWQSGTYAYSKGIVSQGQPICTDTGKRFLVPGSVLLPPINWKSEQRKPCLAFSAHYYS